jgi:hypothetical protein
MSIESLSCLFSVYGFSVLSLFEFTSIASGSGDICVPILASRDSFVPRNLHPATVPSQGNLCGNAKGKNIDDILALAAIKKIAMFCSVVELKN